MTVCIGAVCDGGKAIVVAADRMMTYSPPMSLQVETQVKKLWGMGSESIILFSGSVADGVEVINRTKVEVGENPALPVIAETARHCYQGLKNQRVEETILKPFLGADFRGWQLMLAQAAASVIYQQVLGMIMQHNIGLEVLVAGMDQGQGHLYYIVHPGTLINSDTIGCAAIGSGGLHANIRLALGGQGTGTSLPETIYNVYEAKIAAEAAPGVGKLTDIAIVSSGKIDYLDEASLDKLRSFREGRTKIAPESLTQLEAFCKERGYELSVC